MSPPNRVPRAIPELVDEDTTPPPVDMPPDVRAVWDHSGRLADRMLKHLSDQLDARLAQLAGAQLAAQASVPMQHAPAAAQTIVHAAAAAPRERERGQTWLHVIGLAITVLATAFVLYRQLTEVAVKLDDLTKQQERESVDNQRRIDKLEDRLWTFAPAAPAPTKAAAAASSATP